MFVSYLDEDDRRCDGHQSVEFRQCGILLLIVLTVKVHLLDALDGELLDLKSDLVGTGSELLSECEDLFAY